MHELETDRLILRPLTSADYSAISNIASDEDIVKYMVWGDYNEEETIRYLEKCEADWKTAPQMNYEFGIVLKETGALIGACWLHLENNRRCGELGWVLHRDWWRQGLMTQAAGALFRFCFEDLRLHRVYAHARVENHGSYKLMEKYGMRREGLFKQCDPIRFVEPEAWADVYLYAVLDTEYLNTEIPYQSHAPDSFDAGRRK